MFRIKNNAPVSLYRIGNFFYRNKMVLIASLISWFNRLVFAVWLPSSCSIGRNFRLGYWGLGVVIHKNTQIGDNCTIAQNVTIGRTFRNKGVPIIGNDV